jgi:hypothetical protein
MKYPIANAFSRRDLLAATTLAIPMTALTSASAWAATPSATVLP